MHFYPNAATTPLSETLPDSVFQRNSRHNEWHADCSFAELRGCELPEPPGRGSYEQQEAKIAEFVMTYFAQRPRAMDTVAGIMEWWMPADRIQLDLQTMKKVLDSLTEQGTLERVGAGEYAHYRLKSS